MSNHCTECGALLSENAGYCVNCGATAKPVIPEPEPASPLPSTPPVAVPRRAPAPRPARNSLFKLVGIALAIFIALGALGIIGSIYVVHRITRSIATAARNHGVDVSALPGPFGRHARLPSDPCSLLRKDEASGILGISIDGAVGHGRTCRYCPSAVVDERDCTPNLTVELQENGKAQLLALKLAARALGSDEKPPPGLSRIGDDAVLSPIDSAVVFTKNGLGVRVAVHKASNRRDRSAVAIALAERIASRL